MMIGIFNRFFKKESPLPGLTGLGGGGTGLGFAGGISFVPGSITVFAAANGTTTTYAFPSQWQLAESLTTVVFAGSGKGGDGGAQQFLNGGGGGGSGATHLNYTLPAPLTTLDIVQNGLKFVFNSTSTSATTNYAQRNNDSTNLFSVNNGLNGSLTTGGAGGAAQPGGFSGVNGGRGGVRDGAGTAGNSSNYSAGGGGGAFGRGNGGNSGPGSPGGAALGPYPSISHPAWTISGASPFNRAGGPNNSEYGGKGGYGQPLSISGLTGVTIPAPTNYFGGGGGGAEPSNWNGGATPGYPGFFLVYVEGSIPEE